MSENPNPLKTESEKNNPLKNDFDIPALGEFQNEQSSTIFTTFNPIKRSLRFVKRIRRLLNAKSDVVISRENAKTLNTLVFILIFLSLLIYITYEIFY